MRQSLRMVTCGMVLCVVGRMGSGAEVASQDSHWSFRPLRCVRVPDIKDESWPLNAIDHFVLAGLEERGWRPNPPAAPQALLRRVYLDLLGIPPTLTEQSTYHSASRPNAYEHLVRTLLDRPGYGERYGRYWLDVVRYADSNGYERDAAKPEVWRYRDYVIESLNSDKPFDRFIVEQLAGDEIPDATTDSLIATGFNRLGPWDDEPADFAVDRFNQLDDIVNTTSQAFLGITLSCARCHDHKFDPFTQRDYYSMVAIFDPLKRPQDGRTERTLPAASPRLVREFETRDRHGKIPQGYFLHEPSPEAPTTRILLRGSPANPGELVAPAVPASLVVHQPQFGPPDEFTTRRRLALARWITSPNNPLTARVIVNRVWQWHFGEGLVRTPNDLGVVGERPTHPELLDYLAYWFVHDARWSLKKLHYLILTSRTWQMSRLRREDYAAADPTNRWLWRQAYRRLEVEAIRDSMLAVSGQLDREMYGPPMHPFIPREALLSHADKTTIWPEFDERSASRRTIYAFVKRSLMVPFLEVLDFCDTTSTAAKRNTTTVPTQALTLFNGDFTNRQARHLATRVRREAGSELGRQIDLAFRLALCRSPTENEISKMTGFVNAYRDSGETGPPDPGDGLVQLCRVILNLNEFVYPE